MAGDAGAPSAPVGVAEPGRGYADHVSPSLLPVAATVLALAGVRDGETVLDVGCGAGLLTHPAAAAAGPDARVYGLDLDPTLLDVARRRRASAVCWVRGEPVRLPFRDRGVDKVLCGSVLHRLADVRPALAEWRRVLAPGGRVAVSAWGELLDGPAESAVAAALAAEGVDPAAYGRRVPLVAGGSPRDAAELPDLLRAAGLRVVHETADEVTLPFVGGAAYAAWRLSFASAAAAVPSDVVSDVVAALGPAPVSVHARIHYVTATAG